QIKEFDNLIFVCYNGLLSYNNNQENLLYNNDLSLRTKGEYGIISEIYSINNSNYLVISDNGIYRYNYKLNTFQLIYSTQNKIIPIRNKIESRINDRAEFHFVDNKKYISLNVNTNNIDIIDNNIEYEINDILESDINGNDFYAISKNNLLHLKRTIKGLVLINKFPIKSTAHTISDYNNLIFLAGNNGLSIFDKTKEKMIENYIVDEFNTNAVYKNKNTISFGSIHGVYKIDNISDLERELIFRDFKISEPFRYIYLGVLIFIIIILILFRKKYKKTNVTDEQMIISIKRFINKNLEHATLKMIESEFQLDYNEMNNLSKEFKPAKFIKERRIDLTKKMILNDNSISEISKKTGYSETYLVKNKYKFLK
ncbi:MAG: AraC-like DNA-binding protein, partial [Polaribacter sp.]